MLSCDFSSLPNFSYKTEKRINCTGIKEGNIAILFENLNSNKAHGWDNVSICMILLYNL